MIKVTILSGSYAGRTRAMPDDVDPAALLQSFLQHGWDWRVDYSEATPEEEWAWGRQDLVARFLRALKRGLPVTFLGKEYRGIEKAQALEDAIAGSGRMVTIERDDEDGLVIVAKGWEQ